MVTRLAFMAHKLVSLNNKTWYASATSNSHMRQSNGALLISSSVDCWYLLISHSATVPGLYLLGFGVFVLGSFPPLCLASALATASLLASFLDSDGAPDALFLAVCFVLAMLMLCAFMTE